MKIPPKEVLDHIAAKGYTPACKGKRWNKRGNMWELPFSRPQFESTLYLIRVWDISDDGFNIEIFQHSYSETLQLSTKQ